MDIPSISSSWEIPTSSLSNPGTLSSSAILGDIDMEEFPPVSAVSPEQYSICTRLWMQREAWFEFMKKYRLKFLVWFFLNLVALVLFVLRFACPIDYPAVFTAVASVVYVCSFTFGWVTIPEGPDILASTDPEKNISKE